MSNYEVGDVVTLKEDETAKNSRGDALHSGVVYKVTGVDNAKYSEFIQVNDMDYWWSAGRFYDKDPNRDARFYVGHLTHSDTFWLDSTFDNEEQAEDFARKSAENSHYTYQVLTVYSTFKLENKVVKS